MLVPPSLHNAADELPLPEPATGWRRVLLLVVAAITFVLGILGSILPAIPATPFLLVTSYCLVRTSPRLHRRLLNSPWLGGILRDWQQHRGIRRHTKIQAIAVVLLAVGGSFHFSAMPLPFRLGIVLLAGVGITIIARLPVIDQPAECGDSHPR